MSFSNIRTWRIEGRNDLLALLDLSSADSLDFWSTNDFMNRLLAPLPSQLTTLRLGRIVFTPESLQHGQRHALPCLTSLMVRDIILFGPMSKYFHCPKLDHLSYNIYPRDFILANAIDVQKSPYHAPILETFDKTFFQETLALRSIIFAGTTMDEAVVPFLASCPILHSLEMRDCRIEGFIFPFLETLQNAKCFPAMRTLHFEYSWPAQLELSYEEFVAQCNSLRRGIQVSCERREDFLAAFYELELDPYPNSDADGGNLGDGNSNPESWV
jgi:hypothetical protein